MSITIFRGDPIMIIGQSRDWCSRRIGKQRKEGGKIKAAVKSAENTNIYINIQLLQGPFSA